MIGKCYPCKPHEFQDKRYGKNVRVKNSIGKKGVNNDYRCTVCGEPKGSKAK